MVYKYNHWFIIKSHNIIASIRSKTTNKSFKTKEKINL